MTKPTFEEVRASVGDRAIELDENHFYDFSWGDANTWEDKGLPHSELRGRDCVLVGITVYHRTPDGGACGGAVNFAKPINPSERERNRPQWQVHSVDPLDISPSILCPDHGCGGDHGFIRQGRWVSA